MYNCRDLVGIAICHDDKTENVEKIRTFLEGRSFNIYRDEDKTDYYISNFTFEAFCEEFQVFDFDADANNLHNAVNSFNKLPEVYKKIFFRAIGGNND